MLLELHNLYAENTLTEGGTSVDRLVGIHFIHEWKFVFSSP